MKEKRQYERFNIPLPVRLETIISDRQEVLDNETRDISVSGTFIPSLRSFPEGTRLLPRPNLLHICIACHSMKKRGFSRLLYLPKQMGGAKFSI